MSLFFTADTHFGHKNLTQAGRTPEKARPFADVEEHDEHLVKCWNTVVGPKDTVYHLGDVCWGNSKGQIDLLQRLNGKIHLIRGNHDRDIRGFGPNPVESRFSSVQDLVTVKHNGRKIILCHYPLMEWDSSFHGSIHLHGHCHHNLPPDPDKLRQDVGVDGWDWTPVSVQAIFAIMDEKAEGINARIIARARRQADVQGKSCTVNTEY